uniref:Heat shock protein n=1 Tax=Phenacoccus solenopsis TaxID=483260 RepID=A0A097PHN5_9HEMI|nr:heat shock protein [Phenacoccus solenopsis]
MSLVPYLFNEFLNEPYYGGYYSPISRLYDQHFGGGLFNDDLFIPRPVIPAYANLLPRLRFEDTGATVSNEKNQFKVNLDVQQFKPEEVNVKVVDDYLVVEGKHEEKQDKHGFISRQFTRRYKLPKDVQQENISSSISSDGILSISAPKKSQAIGSSSERQIPIVHTNAPALKQKQETAENKQ